MPLEIGKTYKTKFATGECFTITQFTPIIVNKEIVGYSDIVYGVYEKVPHLGPCPLDKNRIHHDQKLVGHKDICSECKCEL